MTIEEIYSKLASHMRQGIDMHDQLAQAFDFLGLQGFSALHRHHYLEEVEGYHLLTHYYLEYFHKLIKFEDTSYPSPIPDLWYKYETSAVDTNTKRTAIKNLMEKWITWEKETKQLYSEMRQELTNLGSIAAAIFLDPYICDVSKELCHAEKKQNKLETSGYDVDTILQLQDTLYKKYKKEIGW